MKRTELIDTGQSTRNKCEDQQLLLQIGARTLTCMQSNGRM